MWYKLKNVYIRQYMNDMQWPCPKGFHVPTSSELSSLKSMWESLLWYYSWPNYWSNLASALKLPMWWRRRYSDGTCIVQWSMWAYISCLWNVCFSYSSQSGNLEWNRSKAYWSLIRWFKDEVVIPTSSWTRLYWGSIVSWWIFWNSTDWIISISSNGSTWLTLADKNVWATQVYNYWDTLSEANCGKYFQWWNNYWFPWTWDITTSSTQVDASDYWPWNYYESSTFITRSSSPYDWETSSNSNLRWYQSQEVWLKQLTLYSSTPKAQPVNETFSYTWSDQTWTVPYTQEYIITAKWAWSNTSAWWLWQWTILLNAWDKLSIMVWQSWNSTSSATYWFWWSSNYSSNRAWWWLSWVFTWDSAITASDSSRALVIWWWAWWWQSSSRYGWAWGWETWQTGWWSNYWTAGWWGTQTWRWSWGNAWSYQFNWWNGSWTYWRWWWGWRWWWNWSIWDWSWDDDKWAGGWSWYVISTASDRTLTQWWWSTAWNNWEVTIVSVLQ